MNSFRRQIVAVMAIWFLLFSQNLQAQQKIPVEISPLGNDSIGQMVVYKVKENIRKSSGLKLTNVNEKRFIVHITTIEAIKTPTESLSAISYVINIKGHTYVEIYLTSGIYVFGNTRVNECSEQIIAAIDRQVDNFRRGFQ